MAEMVYCRFLIAKSQYTNAMLFQELCPFSIPRRLCRVCVNSPIHFHFKLMFDAECIENELAVRMLPPELQPGEASSPQRIPQFLLCWGRLTPLFACSLNYLCCGLTTRLSWHRRCLSPPLPTVPFQSGEGAGG